MNYAKIKHFCISNGPGIRTVLFCQGCPIHCSGCFNHDTWDFNGGKKFDHDAMVELVSSFGDVSGEHIAGLSILGGEPLSCEGGNKEQVTKICKLVKSIYPNKTIWLWTGYEWEDILNYEVMNYIDVCVTGPFEITKRNLNLKYCGSTNQRVVDVKKTRNCGEIVLYEDL